MKLVHCEDCSTKFKNRNDIEKHIAAVHEGVRCPCTFCDYQSAKPPDLDKHVNVHHERIQHPCSLWNFAM